MKIKKGDILILVILFLAIVSYMGIRYIYKDINDKNIVINIDGSEYGRYSMNNVKEERLIHIDLPTGNFIDIVVNQDGVYVSDVICPDRICVKTGVINKVGQSIVCLPNRVQIYIEGNQKPDVDDVSY